MALNVAVIGSGNIGTDLMFKIFRNPALKMIALVGIDPDSDGLARARKHGVATIDTGIEGLLARTDLIDQIELIFDATSAKAHLHNAPLIERAGKIALDLTPAAIGPYVIPTVNLKEHLDGNVRNLNMVTCGGQATIPIVHAIARVQPVEYGEIVATIASKSAGPGTRANIDEFTETTANAVEKLGGAKRGKAIIILNPAEPPLIMRDTIHAIVEGKPDEAAITESVKKMVAEVATYVPGYKLKSGPVFDGNRVSVFLEVTGAAHYLPAYAGNLDIMTSAAVRVAQEIAERRGALVERRTMPNVRITDVTLRDGSHPVLHQFTLDQIVRTAGALDRAGVPVIEVAHGDGLAGSSVQYGFSKTPDLELIEAAAQVVKRAKLAVLLLPGIGTIHDLKEAHKRGAVMSRIATHCTEADISAQHIAASKEMGMETVGFLMMSHMIEPSALAAQAKLMESYGADVVYVVDSAGAQTMDMVRDRVTALRQALDPKTHVGFHAHNNLGLGVGNAVTAVNAGADNIDGACRGLGAGAGNAATESIVAVFNKLGWETGIDLYGVMDVAEDIVAGELAMNPSVNRAALTLGYAGVYSSFLRHAENASQRFGVPTAKILEEVGKRKAVGGQEDLIIECAIELRERASKDHVEEELQAATV